MRHVFTAKQKSRKKNPLCVVEKVGVFSALFRLVCCYSVLCIMNLALENSKFESDGLLNFLPWRLLKIMMTHVNVASCINAQRLWLAYRPCPSFLHIFLIFFRNDMGPVPYLSFRACFTSKSRRSMHTSYIFT